MYKSSGNLSQYRDLNLMEISAKPHERARRKSILFVVNVDWFFISHRLSIALAARDAGFKVYVAASDTGKAEQINNLGLHFMPFPFSRKGTNLVNEVTTIRNLYKLYKQINPDIVHHVTIKPVLFGSIAAYFRKKLTVVNAITGLGFTFSDNNHSKSLGFLVQWAYRLVLRNSRQRTIFQNPDDLDYFVRHRYVSKEKTVLIRGSGVDCDKFIPGKNDAKEKIILLASRMIRDKGIFEFYETAARIKSLNPQVHFVLAGMSDEGNPNTVPVEQLEAWNREGTVEWWGHCENMVQILQKATVIVLPSYYPEGIPKILIEAAACGKPIVTTDKPGCREIVQNGVNGILVQPNNVDELTDAVLDLLRNPGKAEQYGRNGRRIAVDEFSDKIVVSKTLNLYNELLSSQNVV